MPTQFTTPLSPNYKPTFAKHRKWKQGVIANGEAFTRCYGTSVASAADIFTLGIFPAFNLAAVTATSSGTSTAGTYGIVMVYRSTKFDDGFTFDNIQSNASNTQDVTLSSGQAAVLTKVVSADTKVDKIDVYAAIKIDGVYGAFYRVVKDGANTAGTITFNIQSSNNVLIGAGVTGGTLDDQALLLATDNDFPYAQPVILEVNGRCVSLGGNVVNTTCTFTNGNGTVTTTDTIYDGIEFWYIRRTTDTSGGVDGRGTYLCRYATANTVTLVNADGTAATYAGTSGSGTSVIWTEPNRRYSKLLNPHAWPADNVSNDYPGALICGAKVPNTNRVLLFGSTFTIAEDYDRLPMTGGLNYVSTERGCSSQFSIVEAHSRLYWLDFAKNKREICFSDGATVQIISTQKIRSILKRLTLDSNQEVWRIGFIAGTYIRDEDVIRWGLYLDGNTVAQYVLELDLVTGDVKGDPTFYGHRYQDAFTYGQLRGRNYIGQYGWAGGIARIGQDNVEARFRDWVDSGTISGDLATSGHTVGSVAIASGTLNTTGNGLKGIQCLIWKELNTNGTLVINPTYYHCRISANTASTISINYVEQVDAVGNVQVVSTALPSIPTGTGWKFRVGVIQSMIGPKWLTSKDTKTRSTLREIAIVHRGQTTPSTQPIKVHSFENFDSQPKSAEYTIEAQDGQQVSNTGKYSSSFARPQSNPVTVMGFSIVDNNVDTGTTALNVESIVADFNEQIQQGQ